MKKYFNQFLALGLISSAFVLSSCEGDGGIPISIPQTIEHVFTLPASPDSFFTVVQEVSGNIDSILEANNASRENLESIFVLGAFMIEIDSNGLPVNDFAPIDTIKVLVGDLSQPVSQDSLLAYIPRFSAYAHDSLQSGFVSLRLSSTTIDLVPYTAKPKYRITIKGNANAPLTAPKRFMLRLNTNMRVYIAG